MKTRTMLAFAGALALLAMAWVWFNPPQAPAATAHASASLGLPELPSPSRPEHPIQVELGRKLFFDRRLSSNGTMSCGMCHVPEEGFTSSTSQLSVGLEGISLRRNAPTLLNVAWQQSLFHDGREPTLSVLAWSPLMHSEEMGNPSVGLVLHKLKTWPDYAGLFERAFRGTGPSMDTVGEALAIYMRTLVAADSRFDRWRYGRDANALSALEQQGFQIFTGTGRCNGCHTVTDKHALFADGQFHVTGAGLGKPASAYAVELARGVMITLKPDDLSAFADPRPPDLGRFEITLDSKDRFAFKTPTLRNVAQTAPYMHNGSLTTLEDVIEFYDRGGNDAPDKSPMLKPLGLSEGDKKALAAFLRSLDASNVPALTAAARAPVMGQTR